MAFNAGFYTRQEQIDAQTTRIDNANAVGSGYIHFGSMERLPAQEALASNWQFAGAAAEPPLSQVFAPLAGAGAEWAVPMVPRVAAPAPSAADRSNNWRTRGYAANPSAPALDSFAQGHGLDQRAAAFGGGLGGGSAAMGVGMAQPLAAQLHSLSLGAPLGGGAFPSALTVGLAPAPVELGCYGGMAGSAPQGVPGGYLHAGAGAAGYPAASCLPDAAAVATAPMGGGGGRPVPEPYHAAAAPPFMPTLAQQLPMATAAAAVAAQQQRVAVAADARRPAYGAPPHAAPPPRAAFAQPAGKPQQPHAAEQQPPPGGAGKMPLTQDEYAAAAKAWKPPKATTVLVTPIAAKSEAKGSGKAEWACKRCSFLNPHHARFCEICNYDRAGGDHDHGNEDGWKSTSASKAHGSGQSDLQPAKSRASAKNEKRRAKRANGGN